MVRFYRDVLGLRADWGNESGDYATFIVPEGGSVIALLRRDLMDDAIGPQHAPPTGDRAVVVFDVPDVDTMLASLWQRGAEVASPPIDLHRWGIRVAYVRDPDGNLVELVQPLPPDPCPHDEDETITAREHDRVEVWHG
jgi:catechol 2,3-dioxygenase-like lactoylglutathione lyase family enzyme